MLIGLIGNGDFLERNPTVAKKGENKKC